MTDLTKQLIYGKLQNGFYYIKNINNEVTTILYRRDHTAVIKEVLAPVPSYNEWEAKCEEEKRLKRNLTLERKHLRKYKKRIGEICELASNRNILIKKLKGLLKECRDYLYDDSPLSMASEIKKIDEVLK